MPVPAQTPDVGSRQLHVDKKGQQASALTALAALYGDSSSSDSEDENPVSHAGHAPSETNRLDVVAKQKADLSEVSVVSPSIGRSTSPSEASEETSDLKSCRDTSATPAIDDSIKKTLQSSLSQPSTHSDVASTGTGTVESESSRNTDVLQPDVDAGSTVNGSSPSQPSEADAAGQAFKEIRQEGGHESSSETSDTESDSSSDDDEDSSNSDTLSDTEDELDKVTKMKNGPRVKGEQRLCDLPLIEDLHISVPHEKCTPIGTVKSFVDPLVIVAGDPGTPALDLDSVLFLEEGDRALGKIFDVFGPVKEPHYCVRFNSKEHIEKFGIKCGMRVYCAPDTPHSSFILLAQLARFRGTDASWKHDIEPPPEVQEFSDDEMEQFAKKGGRRPVHLRGRGRGAVRGGNPFMAAESASNSTSEMMRGRNRRKRQFPQSQPNATAFSQPQPQDPFIPANVPGFRPRIPFYRGRGGGRGFSRPFRPNYSSSQTPQQFHSFQAQPGNFNLDAFNQYWSTYWTNYYYHNQGLISQQPQQHFQSNSFQPVAPPPPPPPPPPSFS